MAYSQSIAAPDRGERGPAVPDKRRTADGVLWVLRTGAPWRDMPERYGNWNSVFVRFTRWSKLGVWDAVFETLASLGPPADEEHAIDSTIVRAHQHAAGVKGGIKIRKRSGALRAATASALQTLFLTLATSSANSAERICAIKLSDLEMPRRWLFGATRVDLAAAASKGKTSCRKHQRASANQDPSCGRPARRRSRSRRRVNGQTARRHGAGDGMDARVTQTALNAENPPRCRLRCAASGHWFRYGK
jgi:putative transposase